MPKPVRLKRSALHKFEDWPVPSGMTEEQWTLAKKIAKERHPQCSYPEPVDIGEAMSRLKNTEILHALQSLYSAVSGDLCIEISQEPDPNKPIIKGGFMLTGALMRRVKEAIQKTYD